MEGLGVRVGSYLIPVNHYVTGGYNHDVYFMSKRVILKLDVTLVCAQCLISMLFEGLNNVSKIE